MGLLPKCITVAVTLIAAILILAMAMREESPLDPGRSPKKPVERLLPTATVEKPVTRASTMRVLHARGGEKVLERMEEKAKKEPGYARILQTATRESIWKLKSLNEEEKTLLWERIQKAQNRIAKNSSIGSKP